MRRLGIGDRHRRQQRLGIGMLRRGEERVFAGELDDLAQIHDRDAMADVLDDGEVVSDEQIGEVELPLEIASAG